MEPLRVVQVGLGPVGLEIARAAAESPGIEILGAVDPRPDLEGRDLAELIGGGRVLAGTVSGRVEREIVSVLERERPSVVLHATGSFLAEVADQIEAVLSCGVSVVSTCEELAYPFYRHPELASRLDSLARWNEAVLLGTGVNPGFVMDKLVLTLLGGCRTVRRVRAVRVVDASKRREPLQRKIGAGLTQGAFEERRKVGSIGHVGLAESAHMIADVIGVSRDRVLTEELRPVLAEQRVVTPYFRVDTGEVAGIEQNAVITDGGTERVRLELWMFVGAKEPRDAVSIDAAPGIVMTIPGGIHGDEGTAAVIVNCAGLVAGLAPGLRTMLDVPLRFVSGR